MRLAKNAGARTLATLDMQNTAQSREIPPRVAAPPQLKNRIALTLSMATDFCYFTGSGLSDFDVHHHARCIDGMSLALLLPNDAAAEYGGRRAGERPSRGVDC